MKIGDKVIRMLAGTVPMNLTVTGITDATIFCGDWEFDRVTGAEIDEFLGWGPPPLQTGSYLLLSTAQIVGGIFRACLFTDLEVSIAGGKPVHVVGPGITSTVGFHPERLQAYTAHIAQTLRRMNHQFFQDSGGGWSFLNLCLDKDFHQWGEHINCEQLCQLAIASGMGSWCMPRELWSDLPGGMPYVVFTIPYTQPEESNATPHNS